MDTAASVETPDRLSVPPALHRRRPLLREVVLPERLERTHHLAVHQSGPEGIEFAGDGRRGRFVEQRETSRDIALQDEAACLRDPADGRGSRVVACAGLDGSPGPVSGVLEIAGEQSFVIAHDGEPRMDRGILLMILEKSVRPRQPGPHRGHESHIEQQVHGDANCGTSCGQVIAGLNARPVEPLPRLDRHIEMACCVSSPSQQGEVGSCERSPRVHFTEKPVRVLPVAGCRGDPRPFERRRVGGFLQAHPLRRARCCRTSASHR